MGAQRHILTDSLDHRQEHTHARAFTKVLFLVQDSRVRKYFFKSNGHKIAKTLQRNGKNK